MSKKHFQQGLILYKNGDFQQALEQFDKAIDIGSHDNYVLFDTRAAVYAKLGETKKALQDAKKTIEVAPDQWRGYSRAAQLFLTLNKPEASLTLVRLGLSKLKEEHAERRASLLLLEAKALEAQADAERHRRKHMDHMGNLPIELFGEIARMVVEDNHTAIIGLSQVSKHWRQVVHNCHYLWDVLRLDRRRPKHKAKSWIQRSKGKLRELSVDTDVHSHPGWPEIILNGVKWEDLRVLRYERWQVDDFLRRIGKSNALCRLDSLDITGYARARTTSLPSIELPNLQHLALRHFVINRNIFQDRVFQNLLSITLEHVTNPSEAVWEFVQAHPLLESLIMQYADFSFRTEVALEHLTCLDVKYFARPLMLSSLPALQVLRLEAVQYINELLAVVEKSCLNLTELIIRSCPVDASRIIAVLLVSPDMQILEVSNTEAAKIISYLATPSPPPDNTSETVLSLNPSLVRCPNLTHVNFSKCIDVQTGPIVRMIKARLPDPSNPDPQSPPQVKQIKSLVINECQSVDSAWLPWLRQHVRSVSCVYMTKKTKFRAG